MADLDLMLEAERRGILPPDKQELLGEARKRGLVGDAKQGAINKGFEQIDALQKGLADPVGTLDPAVRSIAEGATFGFADRIAAGADTLTGDKSFDENLAQQRQQTAAIDPQTRLTGNVVGGFATGGAGAAKVLGSQAVRNAPRLVRALAAPAVGAVEGAAAGAGFAEPGKELEGAGRGAATGLALGIAIPAAVRVGERAINAVRGRATQAGAQTVGRDAVEKALGRDRKTPAQAIEQLDDLGSGATLADTGPNASLLGEVTAGRPGNALTDIKDTLVARRGGQVGRILDKVDDATIPAGRQVAIRVEDSPQFQQTLQTDIPVTQRLLKVVRRPSMESAWKEAQKTAAEGDIVLQFKSAKEFADAAQRGEVVGVKTEFLHMLKKGLDDVLEPNRDQVTGIVSSKFGRNRLESMKKTRFQFRDEVKNLNPEYGDALDRMSADFKVDDAVELGRKFFRYRNPRQVQQIMRRFKNDRERRAFQIGVRDAIEEKIAGGGEAGFDQSATLLRQAPKIRAAFPGGAGNDLVKGVRNERTFANTERNVLGNSRTEPRRQANADFDSGVGAAVDLATDVATGTPASLLARGGRTLANAARRPPERAANEAANILFQSDKQRLIEMLSKPGAGLQTLPGGQRLAAQLLGPASVLNNR